MQIKFIRSSRDFGKYKFCNAIISFGTKTARFVQTTCAFALYYDHQGESWGAIIYTWTHRDVYYRNCNRLAGDGNVAPVPSFKSTYALVCST